MGKIDLTDELLDLFGERYQAEKTNMEFGDFVEFEMWKLENADKLKPHAWVKELEKKRKTL